MFFFFVGGLEQQAGRVIQSEAGRCLRCGSVADLVECEKVLKLFFVPVWRWPERGGAYYCRDCSFLFPRSLPLDSGGEGGGFEKPVPSIAKAMRCEICDRAVEPQFRFCPFCGSAL